MSETQREMPRYRCHKEVWALKISTVKPSPLPENYMILTFDESEYAPMHVDFDWYFKHKPSVGGYYVVYKDGYTSFSPAAAFEEGYRRI